jgi:hypothetical protein
MVIANFSNGKLIMSFEFVLGTKGKLTKIKFTKLPSTSVMLIMLAIWVASFAILSGLSFIFFTSQFDVPFPRVLDYIGSGIIGFCNGLLVWSFVCILLSVTPIAQNQILVEMGFGANFQQSNTANIIFWADKVNNLVSVKSDFFSTEQAIADLMKTIEKKEVKKPLPPSVNEPNKPSEPNRAGEPNKNCPPKNR